MSLPERSLLLDDVAGSIDLHQGGEADVFLLCLGNGEKRTLKRYKNPFDGNLVEQVSKLRDDGLCRIRDFGIYQETPFILYDFVEGVSSESIGEIPVAVALKALRQLVATLGVAVKAGVSHGDLNPANALFTLKYTKESVDFQTVLIDWGIVGPGALAFAAPERFQGKKPDEKSDIFSLGLLLFHWITGTNLVDGANFDEFASRNAELSPELVSEKMFLSGKFSVEEVSALESIWKASLQSSPENRAEDLDELDELLEIAQEKVCGGDVSLSICSKKFIESLQPAIQKVGQKFSTDLENPEKQVFPFKNSSPKKAQNTLKYAILGGIGLVLLAIALVIMLGTDRSDVDETAELILRNSRNLDMDLMDSPASTVENSQESHSVKELLNDLPTPAKE